MSAETGLENKDRVEPPEVDAELVREPILDATPPAPASGAKPRPKGGALKFAAAGAVVAVIAGGGYFALRALSPKPGVSPATEEAKAAGSAKADSPAVAGQTPPTDTPAGGPEAAPVVQAPVSSPNTSASGPDDGDAVSIPPSDAPPAAASIPSETAVTPSGSAPAITERGTSTARAGDAPPPTAADSPALANVTPPQPAAVDPLAQLQREAEARAVDEASGSATASPATASATGPPPSPASSDFAGEVQALRALFESETKRLSDELAAERARADAQMREIASLRANLASIETAAPGASSPAPDPIAEAVPATPSGSATKAVLTLLALTRAVESGAGFKAELARAEALAPGAPAIATLRVDAADGVPTLAGLKARFPTEARKALAASAGANGGLLGRFSAGLAEMVSVRPAGPVRGVRPEAVLSRAEAALVSDDLEGALKELQALQGPARESMASFAADAGRLAAARKSLTDLNLWLIESASG